MDFHDFAAAHGLIINKGIEYGRWVRTATDDKPRHRNGAYKHMGDVAFVQNHATMPDVAVWFPEGDNRVKIDRAEIARIRARADKQVADGRATAARKAQAILDSSRHEQHAYLDAKGFPDALGLVYRPDDTSNLLVIPMRVGKQLVGCQLIDRDGGKKFLFGQRCSGAEFVFGGNTGIDIWCEGFATAKSISAVMAAIKTPCRIHACFSAGNMEAMARAAGRGFVVADNDASGTGEKAAKATGLPYFMPDTIGRDFNDEHRATGTFQASQAMRRFIASCKPVAPPRAA